MSLSSVTTNILSSLGIIQVCYSYCKQKDFNTKSGNCSRICKNGGKHDAFEKFIEENGTSAIWLGGLPLVKKIDG